jgi:hypothetical protein
MKRSSKRSARTLNAATLLAVIGTGVCSQGQTQSQAVRAASSRADGTLEQTHRHGPGLCSRTTTISSCRRTSSALQKIFCMSPQSIYDLIGSAGGSSLGPDFGRTNTTLRATFTRRKPTC